MNGQQNTVNPVLKKNLLIYTTAFLIADQHTFMHDEKQLFKIAKHA